MYNHEKGNIQNYFIVVFIYVFYHYYKFEPAFLYACLRVRVPFGHLDKLFKE